MNSPWNPVGAQIGHKLFKNRREKHIETLCAKNAQEVSGTLSDHESNSCVFTNALFSFFDLDLQSDRKLFPIVPFGSPLVGFGRPCVILRVIEIAGRFKGQDQDTPLLG